MLPLPCRPSLLIALLLAGAPVLGQAQMYRCVQPDGKSAFQDQPCAGGSNGGQITVKVTPPSAPPPAGGGRSGLSAAARQLDAQQQQRAVADAQAQRAQAEAYSRSVRCNAARHNLGVLKTERPVFSYDNKGDRQYIADADRAGAAAQARQGVAENCD